MQNYYQFIIARLNGDNIKKNFSAYMKLVKKGIAGFIVFGGRLEEVRRYIDRLQENAELPLTISSDLERGLGQQLKEGTVFPPAMAIAKAAERSDGEHDLFLLRKTFRAVAEEARYAGINTIFAPVLDINTNPKNPIIGTRAFGENSETVSRLGCEMIRTLQSHGIAACGKHFPGHGDTSVDSHIKLPKIDRELRSLRNRELKPFMEAISAGVKMIMMGHLSVPAIDPSGLPLSISQKGVGYLRKNMKYEGIIITDAMNMGGIGRYSEEEASSMALKTGVDLILHPSNPNEIVSYLATKKTVFHTERLELFRKNLLSLPANARPFFDDNRKLSRKLTEKAITISRDFMLSSSPFVVILNDDGIDRSKVFIRRLRGTFPRMKYRLMRPESAIPKTDIPENKSVITAVFSETKAWKGGASKWLFEKIAHLEDKSDVFISFGSPYLIDILERPVKVYAYWDDESAQKAAAELLLKKTKVK
jgi:beta-glucosidase-like glycosyl hydrolase